MTKRGKPPQMKDGKRVNVYLDKPSLDWARKRGGGNASKGIRTVLEEDRRENRKP